MRVASKFPRARFIWDRCTAPTGKPFAAVSKCGAVFVLTVVTRTGSKKRPTPSMNAEPVPCMQYTVGKLPLRRQRRHCRPVYLTAWILPISCYSMRAAHDRYLTRQYIITTLIHPMRTQPTAALCLPLRHHIVPQRPDAADFHLDRIPGEHVAVGALGAHPEDVAGVEGGVVAEFVDPGGGVPDLVGG